MVEFPDMFFAGRSILSVFVNIYILLIFVYVLATWVPEWRYQSWHRTLSAICEPYLNVFRRLVPPVGMIDLSPMIAILALAVISQMLRTVGL